jgi:hypothetical protein
MIKIRNVKKIHAVLGGRQLNVVHDNGGIIKAVHIVVVGKLGRGVLTSIYAH